MDALEEPITEAITDMKHFWDLDRADINMLRFLSFSIRANVQEGDAENIKRKKIWDAVARHRVKGSPGSIISLIEEVTGITPVVSPAVHSMFMIWESKNSLLGYPYDFMKWDTQIDTDGFGMKWLSKTAGGSGALLRASIYIDLGADNFTPALIDKVVDVIKYAGAVYFRYHLGHQLPAGAGWLVYRVVN